MYTKEDRRRMAIKTAKGTIPEMVASALLLGERPISMYTCSRVLCDTVTTR